MSQTEMIKRRATQARDWMLQTSLPFWAHSGLHNVSGFQERADLQGLPTDDPVSRVRLQARYVFCFARAKVLGWEARYCDTLIQRGLDVLTQQCRRPDGLYGKTVQLGSGLKNAQADLYDTAFALLAHSTAAQAGNEPALSGARGLSKTIDDLLIRPEAANGAPMGFQESLPAPDFRLQNPHMHLFEASMALYSAGGDAAALARAQSLQAFIESWFFSPQTGTLREVTALDGSSHRDDRLEAGHHYEWVWLLHAFSRLSGQPISPIARPLYETALALTNASGRIALSHTLERDIAQPIYRTWAQTEALRAHIAAFEQGWISQDPILKTFDLLWTDHILTAPAGAWIDCVDASGKRAVKDITAATGYHLYGAFEALMELAAKV